MRNEWFAKNLLRYFVRGTPANFVHEGKLITGVIMDIQRESGTSGPLKTINVQVIQEDGEKVWVFIEILSEF